MKILALTITLSLAATSALAGSITVTTTPGQDAALASLLQRRNTERAQRLSAINAQRAEQFVRLNESRAARLQDLNLMRDAALPQLTAAEADLEPLTPEKAGLTPLTAAAADLAPLTAADVLLELASPGLAAESKAIAAGADSVALDAVRAIKLRAADCTAKATAAGLDPLKVCR